MILVFCDIYPGVEWLGHMAARMWIKGNTLSLFMGMYHGADTVENSMEVSQKTKHRTTILSLDNML